MFYHHFKLAWRSLRNGKGIALINIGGLAIGMAGSALILLWLYQEISFDRFHPKKDDLYEVYSLTANTDGHPRAIDATSQPLGPALKHDFPEIAAFTRVWDLPDWLLSANNKSIISPRGLIVDSSFLQMFYFPLLEGNPAGQLRDRHTIIITQRLARRLFGAADPMGRIIRTENSDNFLVSGILRDPPVNSRFQFDYLIPWSFRASGDDGYSSETERWLSNNTSTFVLLRPHTDVASLDRKIRDVTRRYTGRSDVWTHFLFPLRKWHLYASFQDGKPVGGRIDTIRVFALIAVFILIIACINFINLTTARSEKRAREVGIRKVSGAGKGGLVIQFIAEALLTACLAGMAALLLVQLLLPSFDRLVGSSLSIPYDSPVFWCIAAGYLVITGLLAGAYPAWYLSSFKAARIFRKEFKRVRGIVTPRRALVVVQFTFAVVLMIATVVVRDQVEYAQDRDKGYSDSRLLHVDFTGDMEKNYPLIRQELINTGMVSSVSKSMSGLTGGGAHTWGFRWPDEDPVDTNTTITMFSEDADWVRTAGLHLLAGRDIDIYRYPSDSLSVVLNESAVKLMGFTDPVGEVIYNPFENKRFRVVGVVRDYLTASPYDPVPPTVIEGPDAWFTAMHIRFGQAVPLAAALRQTETIFKKYNPAYPFVYKFVDDEYAAKFDPEQRTKAMAGIFAALAIFISCLGLFGLSAAVAENKVKEIGVRKVLGASAARITGALAADFIKPVLVAILVAIPIGWYTMDRWLSDYSYRISLRWTVFVAAGLAAIVIALLTVGFQSVRASRANPVESLRSE